MCLAIPAQVLELTDVPGGLALVEVAGVRREVSVGLLEDVRTGDWVLVHVGFAISKIDAAEAHATHKLLEDMGALYEQELQEIRESAAG